ncbi:MAG: hypothetical protein GMKNLPBB_02551 [Myxococcota bacterium]|nr:hypothetical protein [Myxococcota bacterium]
MADHMDTARLRNIELFANLTHDQLQLVADLIREVKFRKNEVIFREGVQDFTLYIVVDGAVRISRNIEGIGEEALTILRDGAYFGEMAIIDNQPRSADAICHEACTLWAIEREPFDNLLFMNKDLAYEVLWSFVRTLSRRLRETNDKITAFFAMTRF